MKKILISMLLLIVVLTMAFTFVSCSGNRIKAEDIAYIAIRKGSLKDVYAVDEKIDFSNVYIIIELKNDKGQIIERVKPNMLEGFDTSTTTPVGEPRMMRIKYMGLYTDEWMYWVISKYDIDSKSRVILNQHSEKGQLRLSIEFDIDELPSIEGMLATLKFNKDKLEYTHLEGKIKDWDTAIDLGRGQVSFLYYAGVNVRPITESCQMLVVYFNILESGDTEIQLTDISVSGGDRDIYLPDAVLE